MSKSYITRYLESGKLKSTTPEERRSVRSEYLALRKTEAFQTWERMQFKKSQRKKCFYCKQRIYKGGYHVDHRIPINMGGNNSYSNLCIACIPCNLTKSGDKIWKHAYIRNKAISRER